MQEEQVLILLGGNSGPVETTVGQAEGQIAARCGRLISRSRDHLTAPCGFTSPDLFLNRALLLITDKEPHQLLTELLAIERELGRVRPEQGGPASRTIDADILLFGQRVIGTPELLVPHPRMHQRLFALAPAADIAPTMRHPVMDRTVLELLNDLRTTIPANLAG